MNNFTKEDLIYLREAIALISDKYVMYPSITKDIDDLWVKVEILTDDYDKKKCYHEWTPRLHAPYRRFIPKTILNLVINFIEIHLFCELCGDRYNNQ